MWWAQADSEEPRPRFLVAPLLGMTGLRQNGPNLAFADSNQFSDLFEGGRAYTRNLSDFFYRGERAMLHPVGHDIVGPHRSDTGQCVQQG